ncbi:MAG: DUF2079 domain-containing protein [Planctomycetaceae bacterium]|nr:DUF2079 domain-containing protein [Planctomycetaceae bacterium]
MPTGEQVADPAFWRIFLVNLLGGLLCWVVGAGFIRLRSGIAYSRSLGRWGIVGWLWGGIPLCWEIARVVSSLFGGGNAFEVFVHATTPYWMAAALAGWLGTFATLLKSKPHRTPESSSANHQRGRLWGVATAVLIYVFVFTAMNWQLYRNLLVPHGDSAMYEEHLWNLTHGKGFRSYQEDRLFLGEHLQVVHLLLLPFHLVWPSLMMMDFFESLALASGAFPIFWIARRHSNSAFLAALVALGYLFYFPMQFLDIAIDLKTFRPIAFGIPAVLYGLDQFERGRMKTAIVFWLVALSAKEDYAIILAPLGLWIAVCGRATSASSAMPQKRTLRWLGISMAVFCTVYLGLAVKYIIPWFRSGEQVHYVGYFSQFGSTLDEVVTNIITNPSLLFSELFSVNSWIYAVALLVPLGGMALFSPSRLLVGLPLFGILCLNRIDKSPHHHFHAPLIPILFWATAVGVSCFPHLLGKLKNNSPDETERTFTRFAAWFVLTSAISTGLFSSMSPFGVGFWDPHSAWYWKGRYTIQERARKFALIPSEIPESARVYSTDFVHPRFTHYARSYDYSSYKRATDQELANPKPGETYYIVIDTQHPYSTIKTPADLPEYNDHPEDWELLPDQTQGCFIVLKRRD